VPGQPRENTTGNSASGGMNCAAAAARRYVRAGAGWWNLSVESFARALERSAEKRFADSVPDAATLDRYFDSLELEDLALACACSEGNETAWNKFVSAYREELFRSARAIAGKNGETAARDLADSLFAELYGISRTNSNANAPAPVRKPLFDYFHGRSRLGTWLRAIVAQRYIDRVRDSSRFESIDGDGAGSREIARRATQPETDPERAKYRELSHAALESALAELAPRDRLAIALYYTKGQTLAAIGRITGEHEATISRRLDRTRRVIRESVVDRLRAAGLDDAQIDRCLECAIDQGNFDLDRAVANRLGNQTSTRDSSAVQTQRRNPLQTGSLT
jgi:RNA polymerase sigma factor (sigma-70 family)